jgi:hypothetical protein
MTKPLTTDQIADINHQWQEHVSNGGDPHNAEGFTPRLAAIHPGLNGTGELLDRAMPSDFRAEATVAGCLIVNPGLFDDDGIFDNHFFDERIRTVFCQLRLMRREREPIDTEHLIDRLKAADVYGEIGGTTLITEILEHAHAAPSRFGEYVGRLKDCEARRRTLLAATSIIKSVYGSQPTPDLINDAKAQFEILADADGAADDQPFPVITMAQLDEPENEPDWAIEETIVLGQEGVIGAPPKCMKTSVATDLCVSVATGTPFLGKYRVPRPLRVLFMSAESGRGPSRVCFRSVAESKGYDLSAIDNLLWHDEVPFFGNQGDIRRLKKTLRSVRPDLLLLDPVYRVLPGDDAANMFIMGQLLGELGDICRSEGATPIVCHHTKKKPGAELTPTTLEDLSWAGFSQFFRQWVLVSRRKLYVPASGLHELRFDVGGSARHSWASAVTIDEGPFREPRWYVTQQGIGESIETDKAATERRRQEDQDAKRLRAKKRILEAAAKFPNGGTQRDLRTPSGLSSDAFRDAVADALRSGELVTFQRKEDPQENKGRTLEYFKLGVSEC